MLNIITVSFILFPIVLTSILLFKKENIENIDTFWKNQKWGCYDILIVIGSYSLIQLLALILGRLNIVTYFNIFVYGNLILLVFLGAITFVILFNKCGVNWAQLGLSKTDFRLKILIGIFSFCIYALVITALSLLLNGNEILFDRARFFIAVKLIDWNTFHITIYITGLIIIAPFVEEFVFRGLMYGPITRRIGESGSIIFTSIVWSLTHLQIRGLFSFFIIGIFLCYIYKRTKSLIPGIVIHGLINFTNLCIYGYLFSIGSI